jgi:ribokinase
VERGGQNVITVASGATASLTPLDSLSDALRYASAAAALACTRAGAQPSLPTATEVERLLAA